MKKLILGLAAASICALAPLPAFAGPYEDGVAAYNNNDYAAAAKLYRQAADAGNANAMLELGSLYLHGKGVPKRTYGAEVWFKKAAALGNAQAMYNIGVIYEGPTSKDYPEAAIWFEKAANHGHAQAQYTMGGYYENGLGVPKDIGTAIIWYKKAADQGHSTAQEELEGLKDWLAPSAVASAPTPMAQTNPNYLELCGKFIDEPQGLPDQMVHDTCVIAFYDAMEEAQNMDNSQDKRDLMWLFAGSAGTESVTRKARLEHVSQSVAPSPKLCQLISRSLLAYKQVKKPENRASIDTTFLESGQAICRGQ